MEPLGESQVLSYQSILAEEFNIILLSYEKKNALKTNIPKSGDLLIALKSSGLHSNGFSLIRELIKRKKINLKSKIGKKSLGQILLTPTKIYVKEILELQKRVNIKNIAHITGGGLIGKLKRIIPK